MTPQRRHPAEPELLRFLERQDQSADYVRRTADWIKAEFPVSTATLLPRLRVLYRQKVRDFGSQLQRL